MDNKANDKVIISAALIPSTPNTPLDSRTRVATIEDIINISNPFCGMKIYVENTQKTYTVTRLKPRVISGIQVEDVDIDTVVSSNDLTDELLDKIDNIQANAQINVIETIKMNGQAISVTDKTVDLGNLQKQLKAGVGITINAETNEISTNLDVDVFKIVTELPAAPEAGNEKKMYVVPNASGEGDDVFSEYLWVDGKWEKLGTFKADVDLSSYALKTEVEAVSKQFNDWKNGQYENDKQAQQIALQNAQTDLQDKITEGDKVFTSWKEGQYKTDQEQIVKQIAEGDEVFTSWRDEQYASDKTALSARVETVEYDVDALVGNITNTSTEQPMLLFGEGTPQEAIVPSNWIYDPITAEGSAWNGLPTRIGQQYLNTSVDSGGLYIAVRSGYDGLKWVNV